MTTALALAAVTCLAAAAPAAAAPGWLAPTNLSAPGHDASEPQVAIDGAGGTAAVWARTNGSNTIIQATSRPPGGTWAPVVELSAPGRNAAEPQVAVDATGTAVAVWQRSNGAHTVIEASSRTPDGTWSPARELSNSERSAKEPQVAVDSGGRAIAVWSRNDGFDNIIQSAQLAPGAGSAWTKPVDLSATGEDAEEPQLSIDAGGDAVAVWSRLEGSDTIVQAAVMPAGTGWGGPHDLSKVGGDAAEPQVAMIAAGGNAIAVWSRTVSGLRTVESAEMTADGQWLEAVAITGAGEDGTEPQVATVGSGSVAVWTLAGVGPYTTIQAAEKPAGGDWQPAQNLTQPGLTQTVVSPQVAIDPNGNAASVWARSGASPTVIEGRTKPAGGAWSGIVELSELGSSANEPQVSIGPTGDGASVWYRDNGVNTIIQAAGFDGDGPLFPALSIPAAATVRQPVAFGAATIDNWSPIMPVVWSFGDGGESAAGNQVDHTFGTPGTYPVTLVAGDALGNTRRAAGSITVYRQANAGRNVRVRRGTALLMVHCPSPAGCTGVPRLIARVQVERFTKVELDRYARTFGKRSQIGRTSFSVPGPATTPVAIKLTRAGRNAVREAGAKGVRTQLTGPGIQHRLVLLFASRR